MNAFVQLGCENSHRKAQMRYVLNADELILSYSHIEIPREVNSEDMKCSSWQKSNMVLIQSPIRRCKFQVQTNKTNAYEVNVQIGL